MRLTTKGRFAVTAMIDLAARQAEGPVTLAGIAERQKISLSYLEQLFGKLRRHKLVSSVRGPGGGYRLAREMDAITVADIIIAVDEPLDATQCGGKQNCNDEHRCATHDLWANLTTRMYAYLDSVTLSALVNREVKADADMAVLKNIRRRAGSWCAGCGCLGLSDRCSPDLPRLNATTPLDPVVLETMLPGSMRARERIEPAWYGRQARAAIDEAAPGLLQQSARIRPRSSSPAAVPRRTTSS